MRTYARTLTRTHARTHTHTHTPFQNAIQYFSENCKMTNDKHIDKYEHSTLNN
jgi:hypothetical protein